MLLGLAWLETRFWAFVDSEHREIAEFQVGVTIGRRYQIVDHLGFGAMGLVLKVRDQALDNDLLALKILYPHLMKDEILFQRFMNEVVVARKLTHPNLVRTHDIGRDERGYYYISMEYVEGRSLEDAIYDKENPLSFDDALHILREIAGGLAYAHEQGVVHRDLKPANVMLTADGRLKIADFGLAEAVWMNKGLTKTGESVGTPAYMAPEQIQGQDVDGRADIYSFGIIAYEIVSQDRPFKDENWFKMAAQHILEPLPDTIGQNFVLPAWYDPFVKKCCAKKAADRFQSTTEIVEVLDAIMKPQTGPQMDVMQSLAQSLALPAERRKGTPSLAKAAMIGGGAALTFLVLLFSLFAVLPKGTKESVILSMESKLGVEFAGVKRAFGIVNVKTPDATVQVDRQGDKKTLENLMAKITQLDDTLKQKGVQLDPKLVPDGTPNAEVPTNSSQPTSNNFPNQPPTQIDRIPVAAEIAKLQTWPVEVRTEGKSFVLAARVQNIGTVEAEEVRLTVSYGGSSLPMEGKSKLRKGEYEIYRSIKFPHRPNLVRKIMPSLDCGNCKAR